MTLFNLIKKEEKGNHSIYNIFGIKLKLKNAKIENLKDSAKNNNGGINKKASCKTNKLTENDAIKIATYLRSDSLSTEDKIRYLSQRFYINTGYYPNFKRPRSFNEKINWIRFNFSNPEPVHICNKLLFKQFIQEKLGSGYTAKLLKTFNNIEDLNFDGLPDKFVVKTTFGFGAKAVVAVEDKNKANVDKIKFELSETMNPWKYTIEQGLFRKASPSFKVFAEEYIESPEGQLNDYKFMCFHGEPKIIIAICDRENGKYSIAYYDTDWNKLDFKKGNYKNKDVEKPKNLDKMLEIARKLSADFPFVRVDLYNIEGKILAGEMTFIPAGAMSRFNPVEWDYKIGEWLDLSKVNPECLNILPEFVEGAKTFIEPQIVENHVAK